MCFRGATSLLHFAANLYLLPFVVIFETLIFQNLLLDRVLHGCMQREAKSKTTCVMDAVCQV